MTWPWEGDAASPGCIWSADLLPPGACASGTQTSSLIFSPCPNSLQLSLLQQHSFGTLQLDFDNFSLILCGSHWLWMGRTTLQAFSLPRLLRCAAVSLAEPGCFCCESRRRNGAPCRGDTQLKITSCLVSAELHPGMGFSAGSN